MASTSGSASNSSYEPYALGIFKAEAARRALSRSRDAIAVTTVCSPRCMARMTFFIPIFAVLSIPQRSFFDIPESYRRAAGTVSLPARLARAPRSHSTAAERPGAPVIFQEVVHSIGTGEAGCDEQSVALETE